MNDRYLMRHISYHLHTIVRRYSYENIFIDSFCAIPDFHDQPVKSSITEFASSHAAASDTPMLVSINSQIAYGIVPAPAYYFIIGPIRLSSLMPFRNEILLPPFDRKWLHTINQCHFPDFIDDILLACNLYRENILEKDELYKQNCVHPEAETEIQKAFSRLIFTNHEYEKRHNPYDQELREMMNIETGNLEGLKQSIQEDYIGNVGTIARDPVRNSKNIGIAVVSLACRAAIRGGLSPETAYSLCDSYILKIEELNDIPGLTNLMRAAEFQYARMVRELKDAKTEKEKKVNFHIDKCKDYIFTHLHEKITVQELAKELNIHPNYLSALFQKCEGISLTAFIHNEKMKLVKNLLIYSPYSYIEIAAYLGYSSQSHLGRHFKEITGYTLKEYRDIYGVKKAAIKI